MEDIANVDVTEVEIAPASCEEIEITPAMIKAGVSAFLNYDSRFERESDTVFEIFEAMWAARAENAVSTSEPGRRPPR